MVDEAGADFLAWLERTDWAELEAGELVIYKGTIDECRGLIYEVVEQIDDERYKLKSTSFMWERLNADRIDLEPVDTGEKEDDSEHDTAT